PDVSREVWTAIQWNHAWLVQPLVPDGDKIRGLNDLETVVVLARKPGLRQAARNTPIREGQVLGTIVGALRKAAPDEAEFSSFLHHPLLRLSGVRRNSPVRRIDDQRCPVRDLLAALVPVHGSLLITDFGSAILLVVLIPFFQRLGALQKLLLGQHRFVAQL